MKRELTVDLIRILSIGLELACKRGLCSGISLKRASCDLHLKRLPALASVASHLEYREYEYGLFQITFDIQSKIVLKRKLNNDDITRHRYTFY